MLAVCLIVGVAAAIVAVGYKEKKKVADKIREEEEKVERWLHKVEHW